MKKRVGIISIVSSIFLGLIVFQIVSTQSNSTDPKEEIPMQESIEEPVAADYKYGLLTDSFLVENKIIKSGESFGNILLGYGIDYSVINTIATDFKDVFDVRKLRSGRPYSVFCDDRDGDRVARYLVYESTPVRYYVFDLHDSINVYRGEKEVKVVRKEVSGSIQSSLYETLVSKGASPELTMTLSDIYAWTIDFFRIKKGDYFKVVYEEKFIDDTVSVGIGEIIAADFNHGGRSFYSFHYANGDDYSDYFDEEGNTLRKAFLKAPLKFSRISSRYNPRRFHPVLKRVKAHLGTDYAAPRGTPIMSTADGEVIAASYTRGNGNYVKVRHNSTYTTQYLHMTGFAKGIRKGKVVKQGDVIGYVGSTGLATGPHVCYRFWKNGVQVDPYKQKLPEADPIKPEFEEDYTKKMQELKKYLDDMNVDDDEDDTGILMAGMGSRGLSPS